MFFTGYGNDGTITKELGLAASTILSFRNGNRVRSAHLEVVMRIRRHREEASFGFAFRASAVMFGKDQSIPKLEPYPRNQCKMNTTDELQICA
jgi:hypothetical protein